MHSALRLSAVLLAVPLAGCSKEPTKDASPSGAGAAGPTVASVLQDLGANAAKYDGKLVKLSGVYMSTTTMEVNGKKSFTVSVVQSKDANDASISCEMGGTEPPKGLMQYTPVTIEGKGKVWNATKGGKDIKDLRLGDCKLTK